MDGSTAMFDKSVCKSAWLRNYLFVVGARINLTFFRCLLVIIILVDYGWIFENVDDADAMKDAFGLICAY